jgi:hypothetical protein
MDMNLPKIKPFRKMLWMMQYPTLLDLALKLPLMNLN